MTTTPEPTANPTADAAATPAATATPTAVPAPAAPALLSDATTPTADTAQTDAAPAKPAAEDIAAKAAAYEIKLPDGVTADDASLMALRQFGAERGLEGDAVQRLAEIGTEAMKRFADSQASAWAKVEEQWAADEATYPAFAPGERDASLGLVIGAIDRVYGGDIAARDRAVEVLNLTRAGRSPAVVDMLHRLAKHIMPDQPVGGTSTPPGRGSPEGFAGNPTGFYQKHEVKKKAS